MIDKCLINFLNDQIDKKNRLTQPTTIKFKELWRNEIENHNSLTNTLFNIKFISFYFYYFTIPSTNSLIFLFFL